ncbi:2-oxoglutarate-dependent dioxygenase [Pseudomonas fluorescens]|uniref:2OG-Fe(II) oxygenase n=1 Tax=Pseudomonas fluorescens TaxID=294 RepID=UPI0011309F10|nr:2OG-Fe(II) oxygenase [Pseudomonas fluorescens]TMU73972.1 2-oxoglutarate-dependent dioxygenase [Pseudomonas fluorescens]
MHTTTTLPPALYTWVAEQRRAGQPVERLRKAMLDKGWSEQDADVALGEPGPPSAEANGTPDVVAIKLPAPDLSASPQYITVDHQRIKVLQTLEHPRIVVFADFLSEEECELLMAAARPRLERSKVQGKEERVLSETRTSEGMFFRRQETDFVGRIEQRISTLLNWPLEYGEGIQVLRYGPGAEFAPHHDYFDPRHFEKPLLRGGQRVATLIMYLHEPEQGGATVFPDINLSIFPAKGSAVFFSYHKPDPSTLSLHGGAPVIAGEKWIATKWLREGEFI